MISLAAFKKSLGSTAMQLSDEEIEKLRKLQDQFADVLFDQWLKKKNRVQAVKK